MDINERVRLIMSNLGVNNNVFAKTINVNPVVTHNIVSGRMTKPSCELLEKILLTYDNINADWLICGRGEMFTNHPKQKNITQSPQTEKQTIEILSQQLNEVNYTNRALLELLKK